MIGDHFQRRDRHGAHVGQMRIIDAGPRTIGRASAVMLRRAILLAERFYSFHDQVSLWQGPEKVGQALIDKGEVPFGLVNILLRPCVIVREVKLVILAHECEEGLQIAIKANLLFDHLHFAANSRDFVEPNLVDFIRCQIGRCHQVQAIIVKVLPVGKCADALRFLVRVGTVFSEPIDHALIGGCHLFGQCKLCLLGQLSSFVRCDGSIFNQLCQMLFGRFPQG